MKINKQKVAAAVLFLAVVLGSILTMRHYQTEPSPNVVYVYNIVEYTPEVIQPTLTPKPPSLSLRTPPAPRPSLLYRVDDVITITDRERDCVVKNIFYESGGESLEGKIAVAQVTFNRLRDGRWGKSLCSVVYANSQFSWTVSHAKRNQPVVGSHWEESKQALADYLSGVRVTNLDRGTHFHATWLERRPEWATKKQELAKIGGHVFYASLR